jgi:hypothetical protein
MMRRLTLGLRHSPIYYITFVLIYNIIPARIAPRARGHGTARAASPRVRVRVDFRSGTRTPGARPHTAHNVRTPKGAGRRQAPRPRAPARPPLYPNFESLTANSELTERR